MQTSQPPIESDEAEETPSQPPPDEELDPTRNWVPLVVLMIAVPFMLGLFVLIGYAVLS